MGRLALCCLAAALLVSCGARTERGRNEAVRLCRFAARGRPLYAAAVAMANTAVIRTSDWLTSVESEDGAAVARRSVRLTRSLDEPLDAIKAFREQLQRLELRTSGTRAEREALVSRLSGLEREIREIHAGLEQIERTAQAHPDHVLGPQPAISSLQQRVKAFNPGGDSIAPVIERLRRDYGISDAELGIRRPAPRSRYVFA